MAPDLAYAVAIAAGGAAGACSRASIYVVTARVSKKGSWADYPHGTWIANTLGSLILGLLSGLTLSLHVSIGVRDYVGTGFCGSLTTFSTFSNDSFLLIEKRRWPQLIAHVGSNLVFGFGAAALGYYLGKHL
jgi:CrcB protein